MSPHVIVLDASRHQVFLKQQRKDPVTKNLLEPGDRIVLCAGKRCGLAYLEGTWQALGCCWRCRQRNTLRDIDVEAEPIHFGRPRPARPPRHPPNGNGPTVAPQEQDVGAAGAARAAAAAVESAAQASVELPIEAEPLRLSELSSQLREIPFSLRRISDL
jgi:hypothetical protein